MSAFQAYTDEVAVGERLPVKASGRAPGADEVLLPAPPGPQPCPVVASELVGVTLYAEGTVSSQGTTCVIADRSARLHVDNSGADVATVSAGSFRFEVPARTARTWSVPLGQLLPNGGGEIGITSNATFEGRPVGGTLEVRFQR